MAVTTYTASEVAALKQVHVGENVVRSRIVITPTTSSGGTLTVSSIVYLARIPNKAVLTDAVLIGGSTGAGEGTWNLGVRDPNGSSFPVNPITGISCSDNAFMAGVTLSAGGIARIGTTNIPYQVSVSDGAASQFHWLVATAILGSGTATVSLQIIAKYLASPTS